MKRIVWSVFVLLFIMYLGAVVSADPLSPAQQSPLPTPISPLATPTPYVVPRSTPTALPDEAPTPTPFWELFDISSTAGPTATPQQVVPTAVIILPQSGGFAELSEYLAEKR
jgi:hypothetical protein